MRLQARDLVATALVAAAVVIYLLSLMDVLPSGGNGVRLVGAVVLVLGLAASAVAVVPTFGHLLHGSTVYLAITSLLGLLALVAGVVMLVSSSSTALAVLMVTMVAMWLIATVHHRRLAEGTTPLALDRESGTRARAPV